MTLAVYIYNCVIDCSVISKHSVGVLLDHASRFRMTLEVMPHGLKMAVSRRKFYHIRFSDSGSSCVSAIDDGTLSIIRSEYPVLVESWRHNDGTRPGSPLSCFANVVSARAEELDNAYIA